LFLCGVEPDFDILLTPIAYTFRAGKGESQRFSMTLRIDDVEEACGKVGSQVRESYPDLTLHFVVHSSAQLHERMALSEHEIIRHPAGEVARAVLRKAALIEHSSFLGMAVAAHSSFLGMSSKDIILALFNVNITDFEDIREAQAHIYHLAWHAIDLL